MSAQNHLKRTEKIHIMLGEDELAIIDDWRFEHRVPTRAAAVRELLRCGLQLADTPETGGSPTGLSRRYGVIEDGG